MTVTEKSTGNLLAGVGYSSADGVVLSGSISQNNVFGTGNSVAASINTSKVNRTIALTFIEPYWTPDGVSRAIEIYDKNVDPSSLPIAQYSSTTLGWRGRLRRADHRDRHHQLRRALRAHDPASVRQQPAGLS